MAVKLFHLNLPPERVHQLVAQLEALIAADVTHPGIAAPLTAGIAQASAYLVQDFVAAESLDVVIRDFGPAPPADALRVATQLAGALDFAAVVKVMHGALHPRDVLVSPDDVRLTGIGITSALERVGGASPIRRPYTAPERAIGASWDRRADIFSLAALVFELLSGRRIAGCGEQAVASLTEVPGSDAAGLRGVFARALAEDPADRYDTALAFAEALTVAFSLTAASPSARTRRGGRGSVAPPAAAVPLDLAPIDTLPVAGSEPRLPLEAPFLDVAPALTTTDLDLRVAQESRYGEIESTPSAIDATSSDAVFGAPPPVPQSVSDAGATRVTAPITVPLSSLAAESAPFPNSALERSRSAVWPLVLALLVGSVIGFALAVSMMGRSVSDTEAETPPAQVPGAAAPTGLRAREFTEDAVNEPRKSGSTDAAAPVVPSVPSPAIEAAPMSPERAERGPRSVPQPAALANLGRILVRSTPAGARVLVDGRDAGVTPLTMRELPQGSHTVRVMRDGFVTADRRVTITAARPAQSLTIELQRAATTSTAPSSPSTLGRFTGPLTVDSRPAGASVFVDGKPVGTTPLQLLSLDAGEHAIRLELAGYRRWTSSVRVVAGDQNRVTASLER